MNNTPPPKPDPSTDTGMKINEGNWFISIIGVLAINLVTALGIYCIHSG